MCSELLGKHHEPLGVGEESLGKCHELLGKRQ